VKDGASGIGLNNVKRRLELLYPDNHQLTIKDEEDFYLIRLVIG
jgi:two-component system, LytTR family, sensor kinase